MSKINLKDRLNGNELDLSLNDLVEVPIKEMASLPKATHIDLSCNHIRLLPVNFSTLLHIVWLDLSKNKISELPENFGNLINLQYLDLYGNQLETLPVGFSRLKNLGWLDLKNNPLDLKLSDIAGDCLDQGQCQLCAKKIVSYMKTVESEQEREKQRKLKEERKREAARKAAFEREVEEQKKIKKAEKEKRKAEIRQKREEEKILLSKKTELDNESKNRALFSNDDAFLQKGKPRKMCSWMCLLLLSTILSFTVLCVSVGIYYYYSEFEVKNLSDIQLVLEEMYSFAMNKSLDVWKIVHARIAILKSLNLN